MYYSNTFCKRFINLYEGLYDKKILEAVIEKCIEVI